MLHTAAAAPPPAGRWQQRAADGCRRSYEIIAFKQATVCSHCWMPRRVWQQEKRQRGKQEQQQRAELSLMGENLIASLFLTYPRSWRRGEFQLRNSSERTGRSCILHSFVEKLLKNVTRRPALETVTTKSRWGCVHETHWNAEEHFSHTLASKSCTRCRKLRPDQTDWGKKTKESTSITCCVWVPGYVKGARRAPRDHIPQTPPSLSVQI